MNEERPRALLLLSGGIDSAVAGKMLQEKGMKISAVHYIIKLVSKGITEEKCREVSNKLEFEELIVKDIGEEAIEITEKLNRRYYFVLTKRLMLREAEKIARKKGINYLVTGEAMSQVSSQTPWNLKVIDEATKMYVIRPLVGMNKREIIDKAKEYGTYELSKGPETCDLLGPDKPVTRTSIEKIKELEEELKQNQS